MGSLLRLRALLTRGRSVLPAMAAFLTLTAALAIPLWAAPPALPLYQTVPPPEPTDTPQPRPTATQDNGEAAQAPAATATAAPEGPPTELPPIELPAGVLTGVVTAEPRLNIRAAPSTEAEITGKLEPGTVIGVEGRNPAGDWWYVCCAPGGQSRGWVSAEFVQPNFTAAQAAALPVVDVEAPSSQATDTVTATAAITVTATSTATGAPAGAALALTMAQTPTLAQQGQEVAIRFTISNTSGTAAERLVLRNDLPAELEFIGGEAAGGGTVARRSGGQGGTLVTVSWPALAAGQAVDAELRVRVADRLANGLVFDHIAVARAENAEDVSAALVVGMPPAGLPTFR